MLATGDAAGRDRDARPGRSGTPGPAGRRRGRAWRRTAAAGRRAWSCRGSGDVGQEAEVGHVVGLVEHGDLDSAERALALPDQVEQPAGRGDEHVDATRAARRSAGPSRRRRRRRAPARRRLAERGQRVLHLLGQLAGRHQHQAARGAGAGGRAAPASRASIGRPKASVLPEPVSARPSRSRPASASGSVAAWIGNGVLMPRRCRPVSSGCGSRSAAKSAGPGGASRDAFSACSSSLTGADGPRCALGRAPAGRRRAAPGRVATVQPRLSWTGRRPHRSGPWRASRSGPSGRGAGAEPDVPAKTDVDDAMSRARAAGRAGQAENSRWVRAAPGRCSAGRPGGQLARGARRC